MCYFFSYFIDISLHLSLIYFMTSICLIRLKVTALRKTHQNTREMTTIYDSIGRLSERMFLKLVDAIRLWVILCSTPEDKKCYFIAVLWLRIFCSSIQSLSFLYTFFLCNFHFFAIMVEITKMMMSAAMFLMLVMIVSVLYLVLCMSGIGVYSKHDGEMHLKSCLHFFFF